MVICFTNSAVHVIPEITRNPSLLAAQAGNGPSFPRFRNIEAESGGKCGGGQVKAEGVRQLSG